MTQEHPQGVLDDCRTKRAAGGLAWIAAPIQNADRLQASRAVLGDAMGLGKTLQCWPWMAYLIEADPEIATMLVRATSRCSRTGRTRRTQILPGWSAATATEYCEQLRPCACSRTVDQLLQGRDGSTLAVSGSSSSPKLGAQRQGRPHTYETLRDLEFSFAPPRRGTLMVCDRSAAHKKPCQHGTRASEEAERSPSRGLHATGTAGSRNTLAGHVVPL